MAIIRTVLGDISPGKLGITLSHEHILLTWPSARHDLGEDYDAGSCVGRASTEVAAARESGGLSAIVDCTPADLGRDVETLVAVSRRTGVHIVAATGFYKHLAGFPLYWQIAGIADIEGHFTREIVSGPGAAGIKCGIVKVAASLGQIAPCEENALRAAARVQRRLGVGITVHTDRDGWKETNIGLRVAEVLQSEGADPARCVIAHADGSPDPAYLHAIVQKGFTVGIDHVGYGPPLFPPDEARATLVAELVAAGHADSLVLSLDHQLVWVPRRPGGQNVLAPRTLSYLFLNFLPLLRKSGVSPADIERMMVANPRRILSLPEAPERKV